MQRLVFIPLLTSALALLAVLLYAAYPQLVFVSGSLGRGITAPLLAGMSVEQKVVIPTQPVNVLFAALDEPRNGRLIQADFFSLDNRSQTTSLGFGKPASLNTGEREIAGVTWLLPHSLTAESTHTIRFSLPSPNNKPVELVADERRQDSFDAAVIWDSAGNAQSKDFSLSLSLASRQPRWMGQAMAEREQYKQAARMIVGGVIVVLVIIAFSALTQQEYVSRRILLVAFLLLVVGGIVGRLWFASRLPLINDEQFYIHDAVLFNPDDPHFLKTPILITALAAWIRTIGLESLLAIRSLVIVSSVGALTILGYVAYRLAGRAAGWATLAVGFFSPVVMSYTSLVMTEQFMLLPLTTATLLAIKYRNQAKPTWWQIAIISVLIGLATAVRWSAAFWILGIAILLRDSSFKEFSRRIMWLLIPFVIGGVLFLTLFPDLALKFRVGGVFLEFFELSQQQGWITKLLSWRPPALRLSPLLLLSLLAFCGVSIKRKMLYGLVAALFVVVFFPAWKDTGIMPMYPLTPALFFGLALGFVVMGLGISEQYRSRILLDGAAFLVPPLIAYFIFHKVNPKYFAEFVPVLVLFAGMGLGLVLKTLRNHRSLAPAMVLLLFAWWLVPWLLQPIQYPYAGTISLEAMNQAVRYFETHSEPHDRILTGSSLIPLLAGREPAYPISHPAWILPTFRGEPDPRYDVLYDPIVTDLEARRVPWVLDEKLTTDTYRRHPRINAAIDSLYELAAEIDNEGSRSLNILRLKP